MTAEIKKVERFMQGGSEARHARIGRGGGMGTSGDGQQRAAEVSVAGDAVGATIGTTVATPVGIKRRSRGAKEATPTTWWRRIWAQCCSAATPTSERGRGRQRGRRDFRRQAALSRGAERLEGRLAMAGFNAWHNETMPADVDADGVITPLDALVALNGVEAAITQYGWSGPPGTVPPFEVELPEIAEPLTGGMAYIDVNNDGKASIFDYGAVLNALLDGVGTTNTAANPPPPGGDVIAPVVDLTLPQWLPPGPLPPGPLPPGPLPPGPNPNPLPVPPVVQPISNGVCGVIPAVPGPVTITKYELPNGLWALGKPEFVALNDAENEGLVIGHEADTAHRLATGNPFDEGASYLLPAHADNALTDDTYYSWFEVVGVRAYFEYELVPGTTLANDTPAPITEVRTVTSSKTSGWSITNGISAVTTSELALNAEAIAGKAVNSLSQKVELANHAESTSTVSRAVNIMTPPCAVAAVYQAYAVVEVEVDFVKWVDTQFGIYNGFSLERGRLKTQSRVDQGMQVSASISVWATPPAGPQP